MRPQRGGKMTDRPPDNPRERPDPTDPDRCDKGSEIPVTCPAFTAEQRLLILDLWQRSELGAPKFARLVGITDHTLYQWKKRFDRQGPAGFEDRPRGPRMGTRIPEPKLREVEPLRRALQLDDR
jgi:transposase-like protein